MKEATTVVKSMEKAQLYFQPEWHTPRKVEDQAQNGSGSGPWLLFWYSGGCVFSPLAGLSSRSFFALS